jgi:hypothetical protein
LGNDVTTALVGVALCKALLVVVQRDQDSRRLPSALDEDRCPATLELS